MLVLLAMLVAHAADPDPKEPTRSVDTPFGPTHTVSIDVEEGTWMSVTVHGDRIVFDLLGDLWTMPLSGGEATRLTSGLSWDVEPQFSPDGTQVMFTSDRGGNEAVWMIQADGSDPKPVAKHDDDRFTAGSFDPTDPTWAIVRRRTVDTSSIGMHRLWLTHTLGGDGTPLTPEDSSVGEYAVHGKYLYYSARQGRYHYNKDPADGIWTIQRLDRTTGDIRPIASGAGGASSPMISPDGTMLLFAQRYETKTRLMAQDLATGRRTMIWDNLSPDEMEGFAHHGTLPRMDWTADGQLVLWAQGKLWRLDPKTGTRANIPFHVRGDWTVHDVARPPIKIGDRVAVKSIRQPRVHPDGRIAFSAVGAVWMRRLDGTVERVSQGMGFTPSWSPNGDTLAYTTWSDAKGGRVVLRDAKGNEEELPMQGRFVNPTFSDDGASLLVLRGVGGTTDTDPAAEPWYELLLLERGPKKKDEWTSRVVTAVDNRATEASTPRAPQLRLRDGRIWLFEDVPVEKDAATAVLISMDLFGNDRREHLELPTSAEVVLSPDLRTVAYRSDHQLYLAPMPPLATRAKATDLPHVQITKRVGDWLSWSADGKQVLWMEGSELKSVAIEGLLALDNEDRKGLEDLPNVTATPIALRLPRARPNTSVFLDQCDRVLTMGAQGVVENVSVAIQSDRIAAIGKGIAVPPGATILDCKGKTVIPGLVDVHAHLHYTSSDTVEEQPWRYLTALDYGVTTVHDPSAFNDEVFTNAERVATGMIHGPRILSTGFILYGAKMADTSVTADLEAARGHVQRQKLLGAHSVKVYQQAQRQRRQFFSQVCTEEKVLCVPEGGGDLWMDLSMVVDGYHSIEHALPTAPLYADVKGLFAGATKGGDNLGTFYTPTLQVAYGGVPGQHDFEIRYDPYNDPRLRRHTPMPLLQQQFWRRGTIVRDDDWRYRVVAQDAAKIVAAGGHVTLGAHGELQGLGAHWELWGLATQGAMTPLQALTAATIEGARYLGMADDIGSIEVGKMADLFVVTGNPLEDITRTTQIEWVVANGALQPTSP